MSFSNTDELNRRVEAELRRLGPALKILRLEAGLSQKAVAKRTGMSRSQVSRYERGHQVPSLTTTMKFLAAVGSDLRDLGVAMQLMGRRFGGESEEMVLLVELGIAVRDVLRPEARKIVAAMLSEMGVRD